MYLISKLHSLNKNINNEKNYSLSKNLVWASPKGFDLAMDIYSPTKEGDSFPAIKKIMNFLNLNYLVK